MVSPPFFFQWALTPCHPQALLSFLYLSHKSSYPLADSFNPVEKKRHLKKLSENWADIYLMNTTAASRKRKQKKNGTGILPHARFCRKKTGTEYAMPLLGTGTDRQEEENKVALISLLGKEEEKKASCLSSPLLSSLTACLFTSHAIPRETSPAMAVSLTRLTITPAATCLEEEEEKARKDHLALCVTQYLYLYLR